MMRPRIRQPVPDNAWVEIAYSPESHILLLAHDGGITVTTRCGQRAQFVGRGVDVDPALPTCAACLRAWWG